MHLVSIRIITDDVERLTAFYETVTNGSANRLHENFAEVQTGGATLAIGSVATVGLFGPGSAESQANRSAIIEFLVEDVDGEYERLRDSLSDIVTMPTVMPWGNKSFLFRDPDGNLVNLFTPATPQAKDKFARYMNSSDKDA